MDRSIAGIVSGLALVFVIAVPAPTYAATAPFFGPIVPAACHCDNQTIQGATSGATTANSAPDYGCVLTVIQNLVNFGITLSTILFTIYLVITGFSFITSAGSSEARSRAKTRFTNVLIGLIVLLCAWLIVNYVMNVLYNGTFGSWDSILAGDPAGADHCIAPSQPKAITAGSVASNLTTTQPGTSSPGGSAGFDTSGSANAPVCSAASNYYGASTAAGPDGGNKACAWAVNNVLQNAGDQPVGGNAVSGMENALKSGRGTLISQSQATCGDIVIQGSDEHVGICMNEGCTSVISNSSSKATFTWISDVNFSPSYTSGTSRIYRLTH